MRVVHTTMDDFVNLTHAFSQKVPMIPATIHAAEVKRMKQQVCFDRATYVRDYIRQKDNTYRNITQNWANGWAANRNEPPSIEELIGYYCRMRFQLNFRIAATRAFLIGEDMLESHSAIECALWEMVLDLPEAQKDQVRMRNFYPKDTYIFVYREGEVDEGGTQILNETVILISKMKVPLDA